MKKKRFVFSITALLLTVCLIWLVWGNVTVGLTTITLTEENLPADFDGYRIAHVSDLHNSVLWEQAIHQMEEAQPDIICITGDLVDPRRTDISSALAFVAEAVKIAPCYYITGNHEMRLSTETVNELFQGLQAQGVTVLGEEPVRILRDGASISLAGSNWGESIPQREPSDLEEYRILLAHQPEYFSGYVAESYDLVLSGHAHGGQFRLPFIGGLYAPGQGLFPWYDSGVYTDGSTDMIVSRGIGNSTFPIRFNNRPEVILIIVQSA